MNQETKKKQNINLLEIIDIIWNYKYFIIIFSILPVLLLYQFSESTPKVRDHKYVFTVYPAEMPQLVRAAEALRSMAQRNKSTDTAERNSLMILESAMRRSIGSSITTIRLYDGADAKDILKEVIDESLKSYEIGLNTKLQRDEKVISLIDSILPSNLITNFAKLIDANVFIQDLTDKYFQEQNLESTELTLEPLDIKKNYLYEFSVTANKPLQLEFIDYLVNSVSESVVSKALIQFNLISNLLQDKTDGSKNFLVDLKNQYMIHFVQQAIDNSQEEYEVKLNELKDKKQLEITQISRKNNLKLSFLQNQREIAEKLNIKNYNNLILEAKQGSFIYSSPIINKPELENPSYYLKGTEVIDKEIANHMEIAELEIQNALDDPILLNVDKLQNTIYSNLLKNFQNNIEILSEIDFNKKTVQIIKDNNINKKLKIIKFYDLRDIVIITKTDGFMQTLITLFVGLLILSIFISTIIHLYKREKLNI